MKTATLIETFNWINKPHRKAGSFLEGLSTAPAGGVGKMLILGIAIPLLIALHANGIWEAGHMVWHGRGGAELDVYGNAARAWAVGFGGAALFCHARWFWGLVPVAWAYALGTVAALLMVGGGIAVACWSVLAG